MTTYIYICTCGCGTGGEQLFVQVPIWTAVQDPRNPEGYRLTTEITNSGLFGTLILDLRRRLCVNHVLIRH